MSRNEKLIEEIRALRKAARARRDWAEVDRLYADERRVIRMG